MGSPGILYSQRACALSARCLRCLRAVCAQCSYFPGMRDLRESKLVAEKNQKWSGRPLCNPNQNTFTFTGCRSQCTGARGVIWIMVRSFAHHLRSPHSLHRCAQTYHPAPTLCLFGFECASAAVYAALCSVTGCMYISQA